MNKLLYFLAFFATVSFGHVFGQAVVTLTPADNGADWVVPCGVTSISITVVGAGGAGGAGNQASGNDVGGGGGGGGELVLANNIGVTQGQTIAFNVGAGGDFAGTGIGGTTTFSGGTYTAFGGQPGSAASGSTPGTGGIGGTGGGGTQGFLGDDGAYGNVSGYGGFGGNSGLGNNGAIQNNNNDTDGDPGGPGGGGAGGFGNNADGGNGGDGYIVIVMVNPDPGPAQVTAPCVNVATMNAEPLTAPLTGIWSNLTGGPGTIVSPTSPTSDITGLTSGLTYTVDWTITAPGGCTPLVQTVEIVTSLAVADAGNDIQLCSPTSTLNSNTPAAGTTGTWTCTGCAAAGVTPATSTDTAQVISGLDPGESVTFTWTVSDGGACTSTDQVTMSYPFDCNDGPCGAVPLPANGCVNGEVLDVGVATPSTGMMDPGCGGFSPTDSDIWYSYVVPADGYLNFNIDDVGATGNMEAAFYSGPCDDLTLEFCNPYYPGSFGLANSGMGIFTPGETIYIRVWTYSNNSVTFNICDQVYNPAPTGISPGLNEISCGEVFMDPNTVFNYGNNQNVVYIICPPAGSFASIDFSSFGVAWGDQLTILDGGASNAPIIATIGTGGTLGDFGSNATVTSSGTNGDSCLTVVWSSNSSTTNIGWDAIVNCSPVPGNLPAICGPSDCLGGCMPTICAIPGTATFTGVGNGASYELNESNNGCFQAGYEGEQCTNWFLVNPATPGTLTMDIYVNPGQDHDFLVYEAYAPALGCPSLTSEQPIRCNAAGGGNAAGTGFNSATAGTTVPGASPYDYTADPYYEPEIVITQAQIDAGIYFIINLKNYNPGCSNPEVDLAFGGTASVSCEPPSILPIELLSFTGDAEGRYNMLYWETATELNNDYFTLLGSPDGSNWQQLGIIDGAGTTQEKQNYEFEDDILSLQMTYYKLKQTDFDGNSKYSKIIALAREFEFNTLFSSVYPNPSDDSFYFVYGGNDFSTPIVANIYNNLGQIVLSEEYSVFSSTQATSIDCGHLAKGVYNIVLSQGDTKEVQKISLIE